MFQHATHTIVVLDAAWPWASEACRLCRLRAHFCAHDLILIRAKYFCAHNLVRARSYVAIPLWLQIKMSWLRALSKGCRCWCWCCGPGRWCCELAERAFMTGGGAGRALAPLPVLSAGEAHRCWCQQIVRAVEVP